MFTTPKPQLSQYLSLTLYYGLILFISYTLMNKLLALNSFQINLLKTGLYSSTTVKILSYLVLIGEAFVLLMLVFAKKRGTQIALLMFVAFTLYIVFLNFTGRYEVCGCGGVLNGLNFSSHFLINLTLILITLFLIKTHKNEN